MDRKETISLTIDSIANQIQILSNKSAMEENRTNKSYNIEKTIEVSSIMLQLSRTMGELILIEKTLYGEDKSPGDVFSFLHGGLKK